jgi:phosphoribosylamine-glycine ligase
MKFMMISKCGEGSGLLHRIAMEGNEVKLFIQDKGYQKSWKGLLPRATPDSAWVDDKTIFIFDYSEMGDIADGLKWRGHKVFGGSSFADKLEHDRSFGMESMKNVGIKIPPTFDFSNNDWNKARDFIAENSSKKYVFKPSGDEIPSKLTYCGCDCEDLLSYLTFVEKYYKGTIKEFILQEFIEGTIVSTEMFSDGTKLLYPANHTVEVKKFMNGDIGPSTGCAGNAVWGELNDCWIVEKGVRLIEDLCIEHSYIGPIDLNTIINSDGIFGLEWTPRFGYDAMPTLLSLISCDVSQVISDLCEGNLKSFPIDEDVAAGIRVTIPPYPLEPNIDNIQKISPNLGIPIRGIREEDLDYIYFFEIMSDEDEELVHSDGTGVIFVASDVGSDVKKALKKPYKIIEDCKIPDKQYRTDLVEVLTEMKNQVICEAQNG